MKQKTVNKIPTQKRSNGLITRVRNIITGTKSHAHLIECPMQFNSTEIRTHVQVDVELKGPELYIYFLRLFVGGIRPSDIEDSLGIEKQSTNSKEVEAFCAWYDQFIFEDIPTEFMYTYCQQSLAPTMSKLHTKFNQNILFSSNVKVATMRMNEFQIKCMLGVLDAMSTREAFVKIFFDGSISIDPNFIDAFHNFLMVFNSYLNQSYSDTYTKPLIRQLW